MITTHSSILRCATDLENEKTCLALELGKKVQNTEELQERAACVVIKCASLMLNMQTLDSSSSSFMPAFALSG